MCPISSENTRAGSRLETRKKQNIFIFSHIHIDGFVFESQTAAPHRLIYFDNFHRDRRNKGCTPSLHFISPLRKYLEENIRKSNIHNSKATKRIKLKGKNDLKKGKIFSFIIQGPAVLLTIQTFVLNECGFFLKNKILISPRNKQAGTTRSAFHNLLTK